MFSISTAGVRDEGLLWSMRERALELGAVRDGNTVSLTTPSFAWREWSCPEDTDVRDLDAVAEANPAPWITTQILRERFESPAMTLADFKRFSANQWVQRTELDAVIDPLRWAELEDREGLPLTGPLCLAVDASLDRSTAAIAVAAHVRDDLTLVDCVASGPGISWTLDQLLALTNRYRNQLVGVVVDEGGPANVLVPRLAEFAINAITPAVREVCAASTGFYDAVVDGSLRHRSAGPLNASVQGATRRALAQSWSFDRKHAVADPAPLMSAALATWGVRTHGPISDRALAERFGTV